MIETVEIRPPAPGVLTPQQAHFLLVLSRRAINIAGETDESELVFTGSLDCIGASMLIIAGSDHARSLFGAYYDYNEARGSEVVLGKDILDEMAELSKIEYYKKQQLDDVAGEKI